MVEKIENAFSYITLSTAEKKTGCTVTITIGPDAPEGSVQDDILLYAKIQPPAEEIYCRWPRDSLDPRSALAT